LNKQVQAPQKKSPLIPFIIVAAVIIVIGGIFLISNKAQQSDPTMTAAPPPGPHGQVLIGSPDKLQAEATLRAKYQAQVGGPVTKNSSTAAPSGSADATPPVAAPAQP
jgi:ABC-type transport system involved in multi-copper enzyme maturation permease subunit